MKILSLAPFAIACLALLMPRLTTSGGAFGGGIGEADPPCDRKHITHACSGPTSCGSIPTTDTTANNAEMLYVAGTSERNCETITNPNCSGKAKEGNSKCTPPQ